MSSDRQNRHISPFDDDRPARQGPPSGAPVYRPGAPAHYDQHSQPAHDFSWSGGGVGPVREEDSQPQLEEPTPGTWDAVAAVLRPTTRASRPHTAVGTLPRSGMGQDSGLHQLPRDGDLLATTVTELEQVEREIEELRMLLQQSTQEAEHLLQRKVITSASVREMEERLELFGRQEIRNRYLIAAEAEMRAFMMEEQREQLTAKLTAYERYYHFLVRTIDLLTHLSAPQAQLPSGPTLMPTPVVPSGMWTRDQARASATLAGLPQLSGPLDPPPPTSATKAAAQSTQGLTTTEIVQLYRVIQSQEEVRLLVAQRLHDGPAQTLANIVLAVEIAEKRFYTQPAQAIGDLQEVKRQLVGALQETRRFIFELRPMTLDDLGLVAALRRYVADLAARHATNIEVVAPDGEQRLPPELVVPVFRVAQEALLNAVLHANARLIRAVVRYTGAALSLLVHDNGSGFDAEAVLAMNVRARTTGFPSMQERATMLGGWLRIESVPGHGTQIELTIPLQTQRI